MSEIYLTGEATPTQPGVSGDYIMYFDTTGLLKKIDSAGKVTAIGGLELLGTTVLGSSQPNTSTLTIAARTKLIIVINITGYDSGGDIAALRFNGDSGNNYWDRHMTAASMIAVFTNTQNASTNQIRLAGNQTNNGRRIPIV